MYSELHNRQDGKDEFQKVLQVQCLKAVRDPAPLPTHRAQKQLEHRAVRSANTKHNKQLLVHGESATRVVQSESGDRGHAKVFGNRSGQKVKSF